MKVIVPHTASRSPFLPAVRVALELEGWAPEYRELKEDNDYQDMFYELWGRGEPFAIVEHDIIPWPGALCEIEECEEPWCTFPYRCLLPTRIGGPERAVGWLCRGLGCAKFNPASRSLDIPAPPSFPSGWRSFDRVVAHKLGWEPHIHTPGVTHLKGSLLPNAQ